MPVEAPSSPAITLIDLPVASLDLDSGTQVRPEMNPETVREYMEALSDGVTLPPVRVVTDDVTFWLWDGFHRVDAHLQLDISTIKAEVRPGTLRDAQMLAVGANYNHGLPRDDATKRRAVEMLLDDPEWSTRSQAWIAETARVSRGLVRKILDDRAEAGTPRPEKTVGADGRARSAPENPSETVNMSRDMLSTTYASGPPAPIQTAQPTNGHVPYSLETTQIAAEPGEDGPDDSLAANPEEPITKPAPSLLDADPEADFLQGLPLMLLLSGAPLANFREDALHYYRMAEAKAAFEKAARPHLSHPPGMSLISAYNARKFVGQPHPKHWLACKNCKNTGRLSSGGQCAGCSGRGYVEASALER